MINEMECPVYKNEKQIAVLKSKPDLTTFEKITNRITHQTGISKELLKSKSRQRELVNARVAFSVHAKKTNKTHEQIGFYLNRNHCTITHYINNNSEIPEIKKLISLIS